MVMTGRRLSSAVLSPLLIRWLVIPGAVALRVGLASIRTTHRGGALHAKADVSETFFAALATGAGVECTSLGVKDFGGIRGVYALEDLPPAARAIAVPSSEALQVTTGQPCPSWAPEAVWKVSKWDTRLALCLLRASSEKPTSDARRQWLRMLPDSFNTPFFWSEERVASLEYDPAVQAILTQRQEWAARYDQLSTATRDDEKDFQLPSRERFYWALSCVRSRAFSGPYAGGTLQGALQQMAFGSALAGTYVLSGLGTLDQAANGLLAVVISIIASDFFFARFSPAKRYVLCPWIDLLNHHSSQAASQLTYEYFTDKFAATLDPRSAPLKAGEQVLISYGPRSNDQLLQYYGFVEAGNPHDTFEMTQEAFLLALNAAVTYDPPLLRRLRDAELTAPDAKVLFSRDGADARARRIARLLLTPESEQVDGGKLPAAALASELLVLRALADVARAEQTGLAVLESADATATISSAAAAAGGSGAAGKLQQAKTPKKAARKAAGGSRNAPDGAAELVASFRSEKASILGEAISALQRTVEDSERAGRLVEAETSSLMNAAQPPGLGLSLIK